MDEVKTFFTDHNRAPPMCPHLPPPPGAASDHLKSLAAAGFVKIVEALFETARNTPTKNVEGVQLLYLFPKNTTTLVASGKYELESV